jgi:hypothetical protein
MSDDAGTDGKSNSVAFVFVTGVETFEDTEDTLGIVRVKAYAVVGQREEPFVALFGGGESHGWAALGVTVFQGVSY